MTIVGAAIVLLGAFAVVERSTTFPLMPPALLARRNILGANLFGFMLAAGQLAAFYFASLYVQTVWEVEPGIAGALFLPFSFCVIIGVVAAPKIAARIGRRNALALHGMIAALGLGLFSRMPVEFDFWLGVLAPSAVCAIGVGGAMVLVGAVATSGVSEGEAGLVSGIVNSARQLGGTIGLAVLVTLASTFDAPRDG
ncbi:MFS transporter [Gordonia iterans]